MPKYHVGIREVHVSTVVVTAADEEEALKKAGEGNFDFDQIDLEYSHSLDPDVWSVEKVED